MTGDPIIFGEPSFDHREQDLAREVIASGWIGQGPLVERFEREFADYIGASHTVAVSSCTAALELALRAIGVGSGDEVITTPMTFIATANAIESVGAKVVLVDIDEATLLISPEAVRAALTPSTKALMPVSFGGRPLDVTGFMALLDEHPDLWTVEDAAHATGAIAGRTPVGGDRHPRWISCFSFYPNKNLASAEGGALTTTDPDVANRVRSLRLHGLDVDAWQRYRTNRFEPSLAVRPGAKANWTDLQAAIALPQLEKLEGFLATREWIAERYDERLGHDPHVSVVARSAPTLSERHALHLYQVRVDGSVRDEVIGDLRSNGIGAAVHYIGVNLHPRFEGSGFPGQPVSDRLSSELISLPIHPGLHEAACDRVVTALAQSLEQRLQSRVPRP